MFVIIAGNPGKHVRTVDIPEPVQTPSWPVPTVEPVQTPAPVKERELVPSR
jgi:hypothetical protein